MTADAVPRLDYEGADLAACLYYMKETKDPILETIISEVRQVLSSFEGFEFNFVGVDKVVLSMKFNNGRGSINAARMSHGNLIFSGLMVLTHSKNRPPVMLIEEPENGLTPAALKRFYLAVRGLAFREDQTERSQVLISSHSPFIVSDAVVEHHIVLAKDKEGRPSVLGLRNAEELMSGYYV